MFHNIFYAGYIGYNGERFKGNHVPMVSLEEFERVQKILGSGDKTKTRKNVFSYTGIIRCGECGCLITADKKTKTLRTTKQEVIYTYYHCAYGKNTLTYRCSERKNILEGNLESQIQDIIAGITIIPEFKDWALGVLRRQHEQETADTNDMVGSISRTLASEERKLDTALQLLLNETITESEYRKQKESIQATIVQLKAETRIIEERRYNWVDLAEKTFDFAVHARQRFQEGDSMTKRHILMTLGTNFLLQ